jgi:hypothetical protein
MFVWNNEQVATDIWIAVEYDETPGSSVDYVIGFVIVDVGVEKTKNAASGFGSAAGRDVFSSPGTP